MHKNPMPCTDKAACAYVSSSPSVVGAHIVIALKYTNYFMGFQYFLIDHS